MGIERIFKIKFRLSPATWCSLDYGVTIKSVADEVFQSKSLYLVITMIFPDAPLGSVNTICVEEDDVTMAAIPLKNTVLSAATELKFLPVTVTTVPTGPL